MEGNDPRSCANCAVRACDDRGAAGETRAYPAFCLTERTPDAAFEATAALYRDDPDTARIFQAAAEVEGLYYSQLTRVEEVLSLIHILALEPNRDRIRGRFLENVIVKSIPGAVCAVLGVLAVNAVGRLALGLDYGQVSTLCVLLVAWVGVMLIVRLSVPFTPIRSALLVVVVGLSLIHIWTTTATCSAARCTRGAARSRRTARRRGGACWVPGRSRCSPLSPRSASARPCSPAP